MKTKTRPTSRTVREYTRPTPSPSAAAAPQSPARVSDFLTLCFYPGMKPAAAARPAYSPTAV